MRRGYERGFQQGFRRGVAKTLHRLLRHRFGPLPDWVEPKLQEETLSQLEQWTDQLLDADALERVFRE